MTVLAIRPKTIPVDDAAPERVCYRCGCEEVDGVFDGWCRVKVHARSSTSPRTGWYLSDLCPLCTDELRGWLHASKRKYRW